MDHLEKKFHTTARGFKYCYYISSVPVDSTKPTLVLCHGWPDSADLWQFVVPQLLQSKLRLVVPDLLGSGESSKPTSPEAFEIKGMTDDVMEILQAESIDKQIIPMGHDWYGML